MIRALMDWWAARCRRIDLEILWPTCKRLAEEEGRPFDHAKAAFAVHAYNDWAWLRLGQREIYRQIEGLT